VCEDLAPHWLWRSLHGVPELPPAAFEVFESSPSPRIFRYAVHPPRSFGPPTEYDETSPPPVSRRAAPSMRLSCLFAPWAPRVRRHDGFHATAAFRPQVFATSRRFTPRCASQACFIPLARPGFALQGFPLARSRYGLSPQPCPLVVTAPTPPLAKRPRRSPTAGPCSPGRVRCHQATVKRQGARSPPGLLPLQGLPHLGVGTCFHAPPLTSLPAHPYETFAQVLPRVFRHRRMGSSLARRPALTEVL